MKYCIGFNSKGMMITFWIAYLHCSWLGRVVLDTTYTTYQKKLKNIKPDNLEKSWKDIWKTELSSALAGWHDTTDNKISKFQPFSKGKKKKKQPMLARFEF